MSLIVQLYFPPTTQSIEKIKPPPCGEGENRLQHSYSFWFTQRCRGSVSSAPSDYEDQIKLIGSFSTVGSVMECYNNLNLVLNPLLFRVYIVDRNR